jgi:antitoxin (DNA-binding transcriptional repressor) of toxin-antitoxin stability system
MKTISIEEFRSHVDDCLGETAKGDVILTQNGRPWILLRALQEDETSDPAFRELIRQRRLEQGIPWEEAKKQLNLEE